MDPADAPAWGEDLLSEPERARAGSIPTTASRQRFTAATALLKVAVAASSGGDPFAVRITRDCPDCRRLHGRPMVVGGTPHVSLSHSGDLVAVALCADAPVGVDVEQVRPDIDVDNMLSFVFGDDERRVFDQVSGQQARLEAFVRAWTRKEAVLKATGDGLRVPMPDVTLSARGAQVRLTGLTGRPELAGAAQILDLHPGPGYLGAVTVLSAQPVRLRVRDGAEAFARHGARGPATTSVPRS